MKQFGKDHAESSHFFLIHFLLTMLYTRFFLTFRRSERNVVTFPSLSSYALQDWPSHTPSCTGFWPLMAHSSLLLWKWFSPKAREQPPSDDFLRWGYNWGRLWRATLGPELPVELAASSTAAASQTEFYLCPICLFFHLFLVWSWGYFPIPAFQIVSETVYRGAKREVGLGCYSGRGQGQDTTAGKIIFFLGILAVLKREPLADS